MWVLKQLHPIGSLEEEEEQLFCLIGGWTEGVPQPILGSRLLRGLIRKVQEPTGRGHGRNHTSSNSSVL